jgi:hypothetical protein
VRGNATGSALRAGFLRGKRSTKAKLKRQEVSHVDVTPSFKLGRVLIDLLGRSDRCRKNKRWFVYAQEPFAGPKAVLAYLSRYTYRVAISNSRLLKTGGKRVTFRVKNYRGEPTRGAMIARPRCAGD